MHILPQSILKVALFGGVSYSAWALIVYFRLVGNTRASSKKISKDMVPRFFFYMNGVFGADFPKKTFKQ